LYSITRAQKQRDGRTLYGNLDVGHALVSGPSGDLGACVGYRYLYERQNMFGDQQLATNMVVGVPPRPPSVLLITETEAWSGLAVGLNTRVALAERWRLELDGAWLPYLGFWGIDNHWHQSSVDLAPEQAQGWGAQFEGVITYALTDQWSVGVGGRYWYFATTNAFTQVPALRPRSPMTLYPHLQL